MKTEHWILTAGIILTILITPIGIPVLTIGLFLSLKEPLAKWIASFLDEINKNRKS